MLSFFKPGVFWLLKNAHYVCCICIVVAAVTSVGNFQVFISKQTLNNRDQESSVLVRFLWDAALLLGFMGQHTLMATLWVKNKLASWLGITVSQRLLYTAASSFTLLFCILRWHVIPEAGLWVIDTSERWLLWLMFLLLHVVAWFLWTLQVLLMDVGEMLGVSQCSMSCYRSFTRSVTTTRARLSPCRARFSPQLQDLYSRLRHPGTLLVTLLLWVHPLMTLDRVLLACWFSCYMVYRHGTTHTHYAFAESYFKRSFVKKQAASSVECDFVED
ncbi:hypothetical protein EGW08_016238 [Elysia chlorotica]|uniref:Nuclear envelope membrane protein n=1 Tax=Elysia chlorotica TaxID=188477 RepID=A0A433T346_ELYCH|nr:hypothetical protein EGW08_016238 [Elysia chlorotica]